jgi:2'-5' RNA ligase
MAWHESAWPARAHLEDHWRWRPEWQPGRHCLYWYLTFGDDLTAILGPDRLEPVRRSDWLDGVPSRWFHVTMCDVGFADELAADDVRSVLEAGRGCVAETRPLRVSLGRAGGMEDTVALAVEPLEPLRHLHRRLRSATQRALGGSPSLAHGDPFWPHLSLGYANQRVSAVAAATVLRQLGHVSGELLIDRLVLASVTRDRRYYEWTALAEVPLGRAGGW